MKKALMLLTVLMSTVLFSTAVFAAAWNVPTNVRVVQKSNTDTTGRIYGNIQSAINSITNASATNPYVVKVMPGTYAETVTMKPYVDVVGAGSEDTIITGSNVNSDSSVCTTGTVIMANHSSISNLKVVNIPPAPGNFLLVAAVVFNGVDAMAEKVHVLVGRDSVDGGRINGICVSEATGHARLNNVDIETHNDGGQSNSIMTVAGGSVTVKNSALVSFNTENGYMNIINNTGGLAAGKVTVTNTSLVGTSPSGMNGIYGNNNIISIENSSITMNAGASTVVPFQAEGTLKIVNTIVRTDSSNVAYEVWNPAVIVMIANSELPGSMDTLIGVNAKLVNNYDPGFNPIPNR